MSGPIDPLEPQAGQALAGEAGPEAAATTPAARLAAYVQGGGVIVPLLTVVLAFLVGGLVILITGHNPISTYKAIFNGTGLNWFFPWTTGDDRTTAALNLQQTLIITTPLILTGLAVAFAFRCGLFNIGGLGQYLVGSYVAVWVGSSFAGMAALPHVLLAIVAATLAGAVWAGIAGLLKATVGAHEVISTIMLNWIAIWIGSFLFGLGGPLQNDVQTSVPISNDIVEGAKLPILWGDPLLQGLHIGGFIAIGALVVYWAVLNRTTLGYEVRAVGFSPEAARYGGISVRRNYFLAMAISGAFAGIAGAIDVLGWQFRLATGDVQTGQLGFVGIAVALLGRNTAVGVLFSALLFGALVTGTSSRNLDPEIFQPELATNLTWMIQGLVVLFVGADIIVLWLIARARRRRPAT
jgi:general nucleoside transport system permease protein